MRFRFLLLWTLLGLGWSGPLAAQLALGPLTNVRFDKVSVDRESGDLVGTGHARVEIKGSVLTAREMRYNRAKNTLVARGEVVLQRGTYRLVAGEITYFLQDDSVSVKDLRLGSDPLYVSGSAVTGQRDEIILSDAVATFREPGVWAPTVRARRLTYRVDESVTVEGGRVGLGYFQPLPLPSFPIPIDELFLKYVSVAAGYHGYLGAFLELGAHLPVAPGFELGGDLGYYTSRGLLAGPSGVYARSSGDRELAGRFKSGFIHDSGDKLRDILGERIPEDRGYFLWEHRQRLSDRLTLRAELKYWSDSEVVRDFRPKEFFPYQQPDTYLEADYAGDRWIVTGFLRPKLNRYFLVQERLPEVQATLLPQPLGLADWGLYQRGQASAARLVEDAPAAGPTLRSDRYDLYYGLARPFTPREWLTFKPVAGAEVTHYARTLPGSGRSGYTRTLGEVGFDADLRASGVYGYKNEAWKVDGLRHLVTPRLSYRYIPRADRGQAYLPPIDREAFSTYLQPLGLGDRRAIDQLAATNTLRIGLDNTLQTRDATYGSRDLVRLNLAADTRFDRVGSQRTLSDLHTELSLTPTRWLQFDLYQRFSTYDGAFEELNTGLSLVNSQWWTVRLGTHYLRNDISEYVVDGSWRFNEAFEAFTRVHYDERRSRFVQQTYGVRQTLDNVWVLSYGLNFYEGRRRESSFGFYLQVEATRL